MSERLINKLMEKKPMDLTFAEYRLAGKLAKGEKCELPKDEEKAKKIRKKAEILKKMPAKG